MTNRHESLAREIVKSVLDNSQENHGMTPYLRTSLEVGFIPTLIKALTDAYARGALSNVEGPSDEEICKAYDVFLSDLDSTSSNIWVEAIRWFRDSLKPVAREPIVLPKTAHLMVDNFNLEGEEYELVDSAFHYYEKKIRSLNKNINFVEEK